MEMIQKQSAFFFKNTLNITFEELSLNIKKRLGESEATQYIPIPKNAPPEIPRLILRYKEYTFNFSINRADIIFTVYPEKTIPEKTINDLLTTLMDDYQISINRIGFVQKGFLESDINKLLDLLGSKYNSAKEASIRINIPKQINNYLCNNIESLSFVSVNKLEGGKQIPKAGVLIERDINTLSEKRFEYTFDKEGICNLTAKLETEAKESLLLK
jgi:hypothetical protein